MVSVVIPCYNEEMVLPELFSRLSQAAESWGFDYEIICIDDGSRDKTWELLQCQHQRDQRWRCLSFARNFGHQTAVSAGLYHAQGNVAVILDADLQDPPEEVQRLLQKWQEGYQVVYGIRKTRRDPLLKRFIAWGFYRIMAAVAPFKIPTDSGDFCA